VWLSLAAAAFCAAGLVAALLPNGAAAAVPDLRAERGSSFARIALAEINAARRAQGLRALRLHTGLARAAAAHGRRMAQSGQFGHANAEGSASERIRRYYRGSAVGEAIAWHESELSPQQTVTGWLASPPHRAILLHRSFRHVGIAVFRVPSAPGVYGGLDATIVVADFGAP
jgi:uncharacterized protein YkwD